MRRLIIAAGSSAAGLLAFHYGYKFLTGRCPCEIRRKAQYLLAMMLLHELELEAGMRGEHQDIDPLTGMPRTDVVEQYKAKFMTPTYNPHIDKMG